jgi:transposase
MARPTSLTPEVHKSIVDNVRKGVFIETAAAAAGVHRSSVYKWKTRGESEGADEPYATFALDLMKAEAENEIAQLDALLNAQPAIPGEGGRGADVWTNKAWYLERRYPAKYSGKVRATVEEIVENAMRRLASVLDADSLEKARAALRPDPQSGSATDARH